MRSLPGTKLAAIGITHIYWYNIHQFWFNRYLFVMILQSGHQECRETQPTTQIWGYLLNQFGILLFKCVFIEYEFFLILKKNRDSFYIQQQENLCQNKLKKI